jgi:hypothetical protein
MFICSGFLFIDEQSLSGDFDLGNSSSTSVKPRVRVNGKNHSVWASFSLAIFQSISILVKWVRFPSAWFAMHCGWNDSPFQQQRSYPGFLFVAGGMCSPRTGILKTPRIHRQGLVPSGSSVSLCLGLVQNLGARDRKNHTTCLCDHILSDIPVVLTWYRVVSPCFSGFERAGASPGGKERLAANPRKSLFIYER